MFNFSRFNTSKNAEKSTLSITTWMWAGYEKEKILPVTLDTQIETPATPATATNSTQLEHHIYHA
jgi:hypothetical protein